MINLSRGTLDESEINLLCLGLSFTPNPALNITELERDMYEFTRKLRLIYHFRNDTSTDESVLRPKSIYCPGRGENDELEKICSSIEHSSILERKVKDNIDEQLRSALDKLSRKIQRNEIVIKPADKGSIIVVMSPEFYWDMCLKHLDNPVFYRKVPTDPSNIVLGRISEFATKFKDRLTEKEFTVLTASTYKLSNFYMLPKLHKSKEINNHIVNTRTRYIHIPDGVGDLEGRPINSGPVYHTRGISIIVHTILLPCLDYIEYILKDSFDFLEKLGSDCEEGTKLVTWDIKSLYTSIRHDLFYTAVEYWLNKLGDKLPLLSRFKRDFVMEALKIILEYNYFLINKTFWHQIMGTAMGTPAAVVGANLVVAYVEVKMFRMLPQLYPMDFVEFLIKSFFRFLDDLIHEWLDNYNIDDLYELMNSLDRDLKYTLDDPSSIANYLDLTITASDKKLIFDIYHKPTNAFNYLKYTSCHPKHTKQNIALALGRRIVRICSTDNNREKNLDELKVNLIKCDHPENVIDEALSKLFSPHPAGKDVEKITFIRTFNPCQVPNFHILDKCLNNLNAPSMKKAFENKAPLSATRQARNLRQMLVKARFELIPEVVERNRQVGLVPCGKCKFCKLGYIRAAKEIVLIHKNGKRTVWRYNRLFTCDSKNILYVVQCKNCNEFYVGKAGAVKPRLSKHASDVRHPENSKCKKCTNHLRACSNMEEPFFHFYPFFYVEEPGLRHFMETRFQLRWKPSLNSY